MSEAYLAATLGQNVVGHVKHIRRVHGVMVRVRVVARLYNGKPVEQDLFVDVELCVCGVVVVVVSTILP